MLLCFSKKSPVVKKNHRNKRAMARSWSPEIRERDRYGRRWHDGEEYTRVGNEYRPKFIEEDEYDKEHCIENGYKRDRNYRDAYNKAENGHFSVISENKCKYEVEKQENVSSAKTTKALVHEDRLPKTNEAFRYYSIIRFTLYFKRSLMLI